MRKYQENIYRSCREYAVLTRVAAAMSLSIGERTLANYETCQVPPDDIALAMARAYKAPWLRVQHLVAFNVVFQDVFQINAATAIDAAFNNVIRGGCPDSIDEAGAFFGAAILRELDEVKKYLATLCTKKVPESTGNVQESYMYGTGNLRYAVKGAGMMDDTRINEGLLALSGAAAAVAAALAIIHYEGRRDNLSEIGFFFERAISREVEGIRNELGKLSEEKEKAACAPTQTATGETTFLNYNTKEPDFAIPACTPGGISRSCAIWPVKKDGCKDDAQARI